MKSHLELEHSVDPRILIPQTQNGHVQWDSDLQNCEVALPVSASHTTTVVSHRQQDPGGADEEVGQEEEREKWHHSFEFVLSLIGYAVGVGNLWRFPYLCLKNGGGAFLIPYFFFLILAGIPLFYMEVLLGQFSGISSLFVWKMCPLFRGLGFCMILVSGMACIYYNAVISWILYYLYSSFTSDLPWAQCGHWWNTPTCIHRTPAASCNSSAVLRNSSASLGSNSAAISMGDELCDVVNNTSFLAALNVSAEDAASGRTHKSAAEEFWQYSVLRKSDGLHELGGVQLNNALCLLAAWILVFLCLIRGIRSLGKVVYVTALLPYVLLTIFLVRGALLPGAGDGVYFYIWPDFSRLANFTVWIEACLQVFYSLGPAWGGLITMASFNKFHNNCFRDAVIGSLADGLTSFYGGFVIFCVIGFMAKEANITVDKVAAQGPGLAFVAYPEAISKMPLPPLWAILFFTMLLSLGLDSQFGMFETVVSGVVDAFPRVFPRQKTRRRMLLVFVLSMCSYFISLPIATKGGIYVFQLLDWFVAAFCVVLTSLIECIIIGWIYGVERFSDDVELMLGSRPGIFMKLCWCFITPFLMLLAFLFTITTYTLPVYDGYVYPAEANVIGFLISIIPILPIPVCMVLELKKHQGSFMQRLRRSLQPDSTWGPSLKEYKPIYASRLPHKSHTFPLTLLFPCHKNRGAYTQDTVQ